jgi:hypothetical protein
VAHPFPSPDHEPRHLFDNYRARRDADANPPLLEAQHDGIEDPLEEPARGDQDGGCQRSHSDGAGSRRGCRHDRRWCPAGPGPGIPRAMWRRDSVVSSIRNMAFDLGLSTVVCCATSAKIVREPPSGTAWAGPYHLRREVLPLVDDGVPIHPLAAIVGQCVTGCSGKGHPSPSYAPIGHAQLSLRLVDRVLTSAQPVGDGMSTVRCAQRARTRPQT